jgi:outer membrane protein assembly factor BamB
VSAIAGACRAQSVLTYHGSSDRHGNFIAPSLNWQRVRLLHLDPSFQPRFSGHVYAQPLYWQPPGSSTAMLIVATEDNGVHAIDAKSGKEIWATSLGRPVQLSTQPCGNIDPLGITGTPVIEESTQAIYLDALVADASGPHHRIFALSLKDGSTLSGWPVDVAAALAARSQRFNSRFQNQRGALTILDGRVYVPFGGHFGDCGDYRGWVIGIRLQDPHEIVTWSTRGRGGGIWAPGGISSDGRSLFVATGNTIDATTWNDGEAVFRLTAELRRDDQPQNFFAPSDWRKLDSLDADLGGTNPLSLDLASVAGRPKPLVLALGKDGRAYLLNRDNLGGIGGSLAAARVSQSPIRTAPAAYPGSDGMFVAFRGQAADCPAPRLASNLMALKISDGSPPSMATAWCAAFEGEASPVVTTTDGRSNPIVWIVGAEGDGRLHGYRGDTGEPLFLGGGPDDVMIGLRHFQTVLPAGGRLYVAADRRIYAFSLQEP